MAVNPESGYEIVLTLMAVAVLVAAVGAARVGGGAGGRGALLDAAILATGTAVSCWAASVALWPGQAVDTAALVRTAAAMSALGLVMPAVLATGSRTGRLIPIALTGHAVGQALAFGTGTFGWALAVAGVSLVLGAAAMARGGVHRPRAAATAASVGHWLLLPLSWITAPTLLVVLQAAGVTVTAQPLIVGWVVMVVLSAARLADLSARLAAERAERDAVQRFRGAFDQAQVAMSLVATHGPGRGAVTDANAAMCQLFGVRREDLLGRPIDTLVAARAAPGGDGERAGPDPQQRPDDGSLDGVLDRLPELRRIQLASEMALATADGRLAWGVVSLALTDGTGAHLAVLQIEDVTERRAARDQLDHLSLQDPLTGLANRRQLQDRMAAALARAERVATPVAVLLVDLDRFAGVNERYGPEAGDEVLVEVGSRLRAVTRPGDTVCRLGADHFAVLLGGLTGTSDAAAVTDRICTVLSRPYHLRRGDVHVTAAVGVAVTGSGPHDLLHEARLALDRAKLSGSGRPVVYDDELRAAARDRAGMTEDLRSALTGTGLRVVYQPMVAVPAGAAARRPVTGWEALLRWDRRTAAGTDHELLPGDFFDVAEQSGLLQPIGYRALEIALAALEVLPDTAAGSASTMAVNFSHRQLAGGDAAARVLRAVETAGVDAQRLRVEIDESSISAGGDELEATLRRLRHRGVVVGIDGFGTGRTSLSQLRRLPVDIVKIDPSLTAGLDRDSADVQVVAGLVQLASGLGLRVAAEGVDTAETDRVVQRLGVHAAQGWHYGAPTAAPWPHGDPSFSPLGPQRRPVHTTGVVAG